MSTSGRRRRARGPGAGAAGFTLIEVVVALAIMTVALTALLTLFSTGLRSTGAAETRALAALHARSLMESVGFEIPLQAGETSGDFDDTYRWSVAIADAGEDDGAGAAAGPGAVRPLSVTVSVSWGTEPRGGRVVLDGLRVVSTGGAR